MQLKQHLDLKKLNIETTVNTVPVGKRLKCWATRTQAKVGQI